MGLRVPINLIGKAEEIGLNSKARESKIKVETFFRSTKLIAIFHPCELFPDWEPSDCWWYLRESPAY